MLAEWMDAKFYISTYRPVPIEEYLVYENAIYPAATSRQLFQTASKLTSATPVSQAIPPHRLIASSEFKQLSNSMTNAMVALAIETAAAGYGALVFCGSRAACQLHAAVISEAMPASSTQESDDMGKRLDLLAELRSLPSGLDPVLETVVKKGVAFHRSCSFQYPFPQTNAPRCWHDDRRTRADSTSLRPKRLEGSHSHMQSCRGSKSAGQEGHNKWCAYGTGASWPCNAVCFLLSHRSHADV